MGLIWAKWPPQSDKSTATVCCFHDNMDQTEGCFQHLVPTPTMT